MSYPTVLAIHGGAGKFKSYITPEKEREFRLALEEALSTGHAILQNKGSALDAVEATVVSLEDCPLFNAGKGSVFTHNGTIEMDASIMEGRKLNAGSVICVTNIKNPIKAARAVMDKSQHVMLVGQGAQEFAQEQNLELRDPSYFFTEERWRAWQEVKNKKKVELHLGTVGAVALDHTGTIAAATSTGGMMNKKFGRVGDSGIIGAGVFANNKTCGVSSTGHGEYFLRLNVAHDISALMEYQNLHLEEACQKVIHEKLQDLGGSGGVIAVDGKGNICMKFSTESMLRGFVKSDGIYHTFVFD